MSLDLVGLAHLHSVPGMRVDISTTDTARCHLRLRGALDILTVDRLDDMMDDLIHGGYRHLVLDLDELDFLAAAGLSVLVRVHTSLRVAGGSLTLVDPRRVVRRVLAITELDQILTIR